MGRIRTGIIGGGTIAQVEHVPNLLRLSDKFDVKVLCDPSASTRAFMAETHGIATCATVAELFDFGFRRFAHVIVEAFDFYLARVCVVAFRHHVAKFANRIACRAAD